MSTEKTYPRKSRFTTIEVVDQGSTITVNQPISGRTFVINDIGKRILELGDGRMTVEDIVSRICEEFHGTQLDRVRADVEEFLKACVSAQIVEM